MSMEPRYIIKNLSDFDIIENWTPPHYGQAAFGLTNSYLFASTRQPEHFAQREPNSLKDLKQIAKLEMRVSPQLLRTCGTDYRSHYENCAMRTLLRMP